MKIYTTEKIHQTMARNIKHFRTSYKMSQMELAERADISVGYMNDLEKSRRWPSAETLSKLCNALKVEPHLLFSQEENIEDDLSIIRERFIRIEEIKRNICKEIDSLP